MDHHRRRWEEEMIKCPECGKSLRSERREVSAGVYAHFEVCPDCADEWLDEQEYEKLRALFKRKAFKIGGSLAVRIPKEIADAIGITDGDELSIKTKGEQLIIEKID
jgi:Zn-finger nucleic acid-binding protein